MPYATTYTRTTKNQSWDPETMEQAIRAVRNKAMGYSEASREFNVPRSTLKRRAKGYNKQAIENRIGLGSFRRTFNKEQEEELVKQVLEREEQGVQVTFHDIRRLAYQLAERRNVQHQFDRNTQMAGKTWTYGFKNRHPELTKNKRPFTPVPDEQASDSNEKRYTRSYSSKQIETDSVAKKFLQNFDPHRSEREKRKLHRRLYPGSKKHILYDERGVFIQTGTNICDCMQLDCAGCHFPCIKCGSKKCGHECRIYRRWAYESIVTEGTNGTLQNPVLKNN